MPASATSPCQTAGTCLRSVDLRAEVAIQDGDLTPDLTQREVLGRAAPDDVDDDRDADRRAAALGRMRQTLRRLLEPALTAAKARVHLEQAEVRGHGAALAAGGMRHARAPRSRPGSFILHDAGEVRQARRAPALFCGAGGKLRPGRKRMASQAKRDGEGLSASGVLTRLAIAFVLVYATYNPEGWSYYHWLVHSHAGSAGPPGWSDNPALKFVVGIGLAIGWVIFLNAARRSLGAVGIVLVVALCAGLVWVLGLVGGDLGLERSRAHPHHARRARHRARRRTLLVARRAAA